MKRNTKLVGVVGLLSVAAVALAAKCIMLYKDNQNLLDLMADEDDYDYDYEFDEEDDIFEEDDDGITVKKDEADSPKIGENLEDDEDEDFNPDKAKTVGL